MQINDKAIVDNRPPPGTLLTISTFGLYIRSLCENVTLSTKPEVRNVSQRRQRRTEPEPQATLTERLKIRCVVSEICKRTDRPSDRQTDRRGHRSTSSRDEVTNRTKGIKFESNMRCYQTEGRGRDGRVTCARRRS